MNSVFVISNTDDQMVFHADWVETMCIFAADGSASEEDLYRALSQEGGRSDNKARELAHDAFIELADRTVACGSASQGAYPFELSQRRNKLSLADGQDWPESSIPYLFQLMTCRWSMASVDRTLANIDPTAVFEMLCAEVLGSFWGTCSGTSGAFVFGTAAGATLPTFPEKVAHIVSTLREGGAYKIAAISPGAGDGKLDAVAYRVFADQRRGGLIGFAQAKTGENWRQHLTKLQPRSFMSKYVTSPLVIDPVRIYMVPHRIHHDRWESDSLEGGLLFDRCRITQYADRVSPNVLENADRWLRAAISATTYP